MTQEVDVVIVGAGLIGLATAYELLRRTSPQLRVAILEKEATVAAHQSSHNSGVMHAGVYYRPGSLKATLCREGKFALEHFATQHGVPVRRSGKMIVAVEESELPRLDALRQRAVANGVEVRDVGPRELRELEPHAVGLRALHVPGTAVTDFGRVAAALAREAVDRGAQLLLDHEVERVMEEPGGSVVVTRQGDFRARCAVVAGGLFADRLAPPGHDAKIVPFRGAYYRLRPKAAGLVHGLIYPVPDPSFPFLGVHLTRRVDGEVWAGPNAVLALAREGYRRRDLGAQELLETLRFPGFRRLARREWRVGVQEAWRDLAKGAFVRQLQRYVPEISARDLSRGPSGVRAQLVAPDGTLVDDFRLVETAKAIHVLNAPSPAATASLAIGRRMADMVFEKLADGAVRGSPQRRVMASRAGR